MTLESESNGLSVAKGVGRHASILVDFWHLSVLREAVQSDHSDLFGGVGPSDQESDEHGAHKEAQRSSNEGQSNGQGHDGDAEKEGDQSDAEAGHDVFAPCAPEHGLAGFECITDALSFNDEVGEHEERHEPPHQATDEVNDGRDRLHAWVVAASCSSFEELENESNRSCDDAPDDDDGQALEGCVHTVGKLRVPTRQSDVGVGDDGTVPEDNDDAQHHVGDEREAEVGTGERAVSVDRPLHLEELWNAHTDEAGEAHHTGEDHVNHQFGVFLDHAHA